MISVWKKVHAMKWLFIYRRELVVSYGVFILACLHFFISSKYDFHVDAVRMIVKTGEMLRNICVDGLKMYGTISLP